MKINYSCQKSVYSLLVALSVNIVLHQHRLLRKFTAVKPRNDLMKFASLGQAAKQLYQWLLVDFFKRIRLSYLIL